MSLAQSKLACQPQALWLRRALFQVHLWTGLGFGLYIFMVSLTGSAIVFRHEMDRALCPRIIMVTPSGPRMSDAQLATVATRAFRRFPRAKVRIEVHGPRVPGAAVEVWYLFRRDRIERLFNPYTGEDLGDSVACEPPFVAGLADLHGNLLGGETGLVVNGIGAVLLTLMCLSGLILWWPGTSRWRRGMTLRRGVHWRRFIWDLHNVLGFWVFALILMWAVSGIYLAFSNYFYDMGNFLLAHGAVGQAASHRIDVLTDWLVRLHFGRTFGLWVKVLWVILGLVPSGLIVTGALMWWNRVLRKAMGRSGQMIGAPTVLSSMAPAPLASTEPLATPGMLATPK